MSSTHRMFLLSSQSAHTTNGDLFVSDDDFLDAPDESLLNDTERQEKMAALAQGMDVPDLSDLIEETALTGTASPEEVKAVQEAWFNFIQNAEPSDAKVSFLQQAMLQTKSRLHKSLARFFPEDSYLPFRSAIALKITPKHNHIVKMPKTYAYPYFVAHHNGLYLIGDATTKQYALTPNARIAAIFVYCGYKLDTLTSAWMGIPFSGQNLQFAKHKQETHWQRVKQSTYKEDVTLAEIIRNVRQKSSFTTPEICLNLQNRVMSHLGFNTITPDNVQQAMTRHLNNISDTLAMGTFCVPLFGIATLMTMAAYKQSQATPEPPPPAPIVQSTTVQQPNAKIPEKTR